ncbi:hypothetical protein [Lapidilactobacillus luobeiensis]|uniref:hypothetical protein n=1 Tax=Lapidilactobacillus luobeiensis TaxID=2950371 RepID=UPI0021C486C4|nr:hypothetical protein [Lapidilactobacillus luobeiensis]
MTKIKKVLPKPILIFLLVALVVCFPLPLLTSWLHISTVQRIISLFLILDPLIVIISSIMIKRQHWSAWWLLAFPAIFALSVWWRFAQYNYWLVGMYLLLAVIIYLATPRKS